MKQIRAFWYVFKNSLTNLDYYTGLRTTSIWFSLKYLYLLLVITSFFSILPFMSMAVKFGQNLPLKIDQIKYGAETAFPNNLVLTLKDGQLTTNSPEPIYYKNWLVIDTNAKASDFYKYKDRAYFLITKTDVTYASSASETGTETVPLSQFQDQGTLDHAGYLNDIKSLEPSLDSFKQLFWPGLVVLLIIGPILIAGSMLSWSLFSLLFFCLLVYSLVKLLKGNFSYSHIYKMAIHASTLPIIFFTLLGLFNLNPTVPFGYSLIMGLFMIAVFQRIWKTNS